MISGVGRAELTRFRIVLSLNSQLSAQKLARLLLADPLGDKGRWERVLENDDIGEAEGRAVLIRYVYADRGVGEELEGS